MLCTLYFVSQKMEVFGWKCKHEAHESSLTLSSSVQNIENHT